MPLQRCRSQGKSGWKFGSGGTCYIGPGARSRARTQGAAIKASQARRDDPVSVIKSLRESIESTGVKLPTKKKASRQASGKGLERKYSRRVLAILEPYFTDLRERLIPKIPSIVTQYNNEVRFDTYGEVITKAIRDITIGIALQIPDSKIKAMAEDQAEDISDFNKNQLNGQFKSVLGINPLIDEPYLQPQIDSFVERNAALITDVPEQSISRIEAKIRTNVEKGKSIDNLTAIISSEIGIAENRARLIARDQTNKFLGKLNELRQTEAGVDEYTWSTSKDERVRASHEAHDGQTFSWSEPPSDTGHPGEDINCRCVAIPVFDDFL
ncbi:minor capsid protein [Candidatus Pacearchaeota archaeon]|nr:minor capsid protein [Candidatus Pacearchaeota archaeon]